MIPNPNQVLIPYRIPGAGNNGEATFTEIAVAALGAGSSGQVLTSQGAGNPLAWGSGGGGSPAGIFAVSDASTINFNFANGGKQTVSPSLGGNRTVTISGMVQGNVLTVTFPQDGTGSRTVTYSGMVNTYVGGGSQPSLQSAASARDDVVFYCTAANTYDVFYLSGATGSGTVTSIVAGSGLTGGTITTSGTIALALTGVEIDSHFGAITADTDGATITFNLQTSDWHKVTLGGNRTLALSNPTTGQQFTLRIQQAASGGPYTLTWFSGITWFTSTFAAPAMPTTASGVLVVTFKCTGAGAYDGFLCGTSAS